ncbi:hypothetical protein HZH68_007577 [Vespula germanica]|uniref:Reverse transcriptase domain-containing protein n=1 Tax=Vespula germanica TaxID=30212 RepID=A0A834K9A1_VESGE|nr:hypothetical protein HZH68_007577 [Vespula germanica]
MAKYIFSVKKDFPLHLITMIRNMLLNEYVSFDQTRSDKLLYVTNGLEKGTVNSPILFNIYVSNILQMYDFNTDKNKNAITFADDLS